MMMVMVMLPQVFWVIFMSVFLSSSVYCEASGGGGGGGGGHREQLLSSLFMNYDPSVRPAPTGEKINLGINIRLQHFDFKTSDGSFHFVGQMEVMWTDPKLNWQPSDYGNLTVVAVSQKLIWVPDLEFFNNAPDKMFRMHKNGAVAMHNDGRILWTDAIEVLTFCTGDMEEFPRDRHSCKLNLGSWSYNGLDVDIGNKRRPSVTMNFDDIDKPNMAYKVTNFSAMYVSTTYSCCTEPYIEIDYLIDFERASNMVAILRISAITIIILSGLSASEYIELRRKLSIAGIAYFVITMHLLFISSIIGKFSRTTPSIVKFLACSMGILTFTTLTSIFTSAMGPVVSLKIPNAFHKILHRSCFVLSDDDERLVRDFNIHNEDDDHQHHHHTIGSEHNLYEASRASGFRLQFQVQRLAFLLGIFLYSISAAVFYI